VDVARNIRGRHALALVAVIAWLGVLLQLYLSVRLALGNGKSLMDGLVAFFGYFTVLTNIFVALVSSLPLTFGGSRSGHWFGTGIVLGCATTAIVLVGIAYHFLLRNVWAPEGLQWAADVILHYAVPVALFVYWISFPPRQQLPVWTPLAWCIYPLAYLAYALARGALIGSYPYYFIDVTSLGYSKVLINSLGLLVAFVVIGSVVYGIARFRNRAPAVPAHAPG
jgi:hypothetical protein